MQIYSTDEKQTYTLTMIDPETGLDWARDWVGNIKNTGIHYNKTANRYEADQNEIDWWIAMQGEYQAMYDLVYELKEAYGSEKVNKVIKSVGYREFGYEAAVVIKALTESFGILRPLKLI